MEFVVPVLGQLVVQIPLIGIYIGGLVVAVVTWRRHPRVSLLTTIALGILLVNLIGGTFVTSLVPLLMTRGAWSASEVGSIFGVYGVLSALLTTIAFGLLLWAIFGWRKQGAAV